MNSNPRMLVLLVALSGLVATNPISSLQISISCSQRPVQTTTGASINVVGVSDLQKRAAPFVLNNGSSLLPEHASVFMINRLAAPVEGLLKALLKSSIGAPASDIQKVLNGFGDSVQMALAALQDLRNNPGGTSTPFNRYFASSMASQVEEIFERYVGEGPGLSGAAQFSTTSISIGPQPLEVDDNQCSVSDPLGYLLQYRPGYPQDYVVVVLCPHAMEDDLVADMNCCEFDTYVSDKMNTFGATILHEYLHWTWLSRGVLAFLIGDWNIPAVAGTFPEDGQTAYNCMLLRQMGDSTAMSNAENYVWYALEALWRNICPNRLQNPFNPAPRDG